MDEIKQAITVLLRQGHSPDQVIEELVKAHKELIMVRHYLTAITENSFRP